MSTYQLQKLSRGEYQVIRPDGSNYFDYPVSKWDATRAMLTEKLHERFLVHAGIIKAVHKFLTGRGITVNLDTFIYQYSYQLDHKEMRNMMKRPVHFVSHIAKTMESDKAARLASIAPEPVDTIAEQIAELQIDVARLKQQVEYLNNRMAAL